ncbi:MAG: DUF814 domain-containing protein [candidate division Zixibacteria bacterium]|nr:DUF814 domain-containing protein [candidate division Zixibacteria bacterium]
MIMKLTALHTGRLAREMARDLVGGKLRDLNKSEKDKRIEMHISTATGPFSIVFLFGGGNSVVYFIAGFARKITTTNFLPQLREGTIEGVHQVGQDRILEIDIRTDEGLHRLIFELFGQNSDLYLTDSSRKVITALKKSSRDEVCYSTPESLPFLNPIDFDIDQLIAQIEAKKPERLDEYLRKAFFGLEKPDVIDFMNTADLNRDQLAGDVSLIELRHLLKLIRTTCRDFIEASHPVSYRLNPVHIYLSYSENRPCADSIAQALYLTHEKSQITARQSSPSKILLSQLQQATKKEQRKLEKIRKQLKKFESHDEIRKLAELLSINLHNLEEGAERIEVEDIYLKSNEKVTIQLDPRLRPGENLQKLFERSKKYRDKLPGVKEELLRTEARLKELATLISTAKSMDDDDDFSEIKERLNELGLKKPVPQKAGRKEPPERLPYKSYQTTAGEEILVGKSSRDNDRLTFKFGRKHDLWLHSQQTAGSHVILRRPNRTHQFSKQSILEAAEIAAYFSNARNAEHVPVFYTEVRYVRKARKGAPGLVIPERTQTVFVDPRQP